MTPQAYRKEAPVGDDEALFNYKSFMNEHLYYLLDPTGLNQNCFLSFVPENGKSCLNYYKDGKLDSWVTKCTAFHKDEFFTIMACLKVPIFRSTFACLTKYLLSQGVKAESLIDFSSLEALKRSGNRLEMMASIGITDSSHYDSGSGECLLTGQPPKSFLTNLLRNCIKDDTIFNKLPSLTINFDPKLAAWLTETIKIPFRYGINLNDSGQIFKSMASLNTSHELVIRNYERCADDEKIEGFFPFLENEEVCGCTIECKNTVVLNVTTLKTALVKAFDMNKKIVEHQLPPRLMLIFCKEIDPKASISNELHDFCQQNST